MSNLFQPTALVGAIAIAMGFSISAQANTDSAVNTALDTLVVTATRSEEKIKDVPARISIIEPQILAQSPIAELPHLLMSDASINMVQSGGFGQTASIFIRGTNSEHALILRDGARLNTASTGAANLAFIDTTDIKHIEVLKGPASVLYGTDAIGGVLQIVSKTPEKTGAFVTGEMGEQDTYKTVVGADFFENGIYAQLRGQRLETDGSQVTDLKGQNIDTAAYDQKGFSAKLGVDQEHYAASIDYSTNEGTSQYDAYRNDGSLISQDFKNEMINARGRLNLNDVVELNTRLSQFKDELNQNESNDFVHSTTQEAEVNTKWQFTPHQNVLVGVTHQQIDGDVLSYGLPYDEKVDSTGYFIQHQYQNNGLNTQLGIRTEDNEKYGTHTVAQGGIRYQLLPLTSIYANIGTAFKAPTLNDMYGYGGNPDLDPEESISYEIGIDQKINHNISTGLSAYYTKVDDLIESKCVATCNGDWVTTFPVYQNINIAKASMQGGEFYTKWQEDDLFVKTAFNYVKAVNEDTDEELKRRPRRSLTFTAGLQNEVYGLSATFSAKSKAKDYLQDTPGYATVDLNAYWNINPNMKVFTNIENIGDVQYKTASYNPGIYYVNGGRLASAGVTFRY
jgi:vitamin B12 transporter